MQVDFLSYFLICIHFPCMNSSNVYTLYYIVILSQRSPHIKPCCFLENSLLSLKNKYFEYETVEGKTLVLTKTAKTLSRARKHLYEDVELISFSGKKCRNDICEKVEKF